MATKKVFQEFIQVRNLREGTWKEGKMVTVYLDLIVGPFVFRGVSFKWATGSLRLNAKGVSLKASYVKVIVGLIKKEIDKRRQSTYLEGSGRSDEAE